MTDLIKDDIGVDPRTLTKEQKDALPHIKSPIKAIRAKCMDCCIGQEAEVRKCTATSCALWPFRFGKNIFSTRKGNPNAFKKHSSHGERNND